SKSFAGYGTAPRPPPTYISKPISSLPAAFRRFLAMKPKSLRLVKPQACCAHPLKAGLNLRPKFWVSECPSKNFDNAREYGVTSKVSSAQTPAKGHAVTLRTELPQASRVVMFAAARRRMTL